MSDITTEAERVAAGRPVLARMLAERRTQRMNAKGGDVRGGFTPGPWISAGVHVEDMHHHRCIADCHPTHETRISVVDALRNALMIAAAPDLFLACRCAVAALSQNAVFPADVDCAKKALIAAISKATGGEG